MVRDNQPHCYDEFQEKIRKKPNCEDDFLAKNRETYILAREIYTESHFIKCFTER